MSKSFPEWWKHGQKVRTANDGVLTLNIAEDSEYWLTNNAGKEVSVFSMDILGPASVPEACRMTTDITELAQRMKAAAEKSTPGRIGDRIDGSGSIKYECRGYDGSLVLRTDHKNMEYGFIGDNSLADEEFFRACVPDAILALVDALEYYKSREERVISLVRDNSKSWDELYRQIEAKGKRNVELVEALEKAQQRIAELESRTVTFKLPSTPEPSAFAPWVAKAFYQFHKDTVKSCVAVFSDACRAAGIKWEAE